MSSKKAKLLESAQKNFLKGLYEKAITEYRQLIQIDPADLRHRQRLAEILAKANQKDEAIKEYNSLAKTYIDTIHYLKAIAVYKQIQKLDPDNPEISLTLASLNEKQGLNGNAIAEYSAAIQTFERTGDNSKAIKALESLLAIDTKNSAAKLRLAEKLFTTGNEQQSADILITLATDLRDRNDENGFARVVERISNLFGADADAVLGKIDQSGAETDDLPAIVVALPAVTATVAATPEIPPAPETPIIHEQESPSEEELEIIEEIQPIEDIQLIEDIEEIVEESVEELPEDEWEEEIDLGEALSTASDSIHGVEKAETATELTTPEEFEDYPSELDDLELELETDYDDAVAKAEADSSFISEEQSFDLAAELSIFASEIDFDLPRIDNNNESLDFGQTGFKKDDLDNEDIESHYSLGLAYREMGLFDEAIGEFTVASRSPQRKIDCLILQGICYRDMGELAKAVEILTDTLNLSEVNEDELLGIKHELAICHEMTGEKNKAIELYSEILDLRPDFSDTSSRFDALINE